MVSDLWWDAINYSSIIYGWCKFQCSIFIYFLFFKGKKIRKGILACFLSLFTLILPVLSLYLYFLPLNLSSDRMRGNLKTDKGWQRMHSNPNNAVICWWWWRRHWQARNSVQNPFLSVISTTSKHLIYIRKILIKKQKQTT